MLDKNFQPAERLFFHDRFVAKYLLVLLPKWVLPNHLTVFRFLATPVVIFLLYYDNYLSSLVAFMIVAMTDMLDGSMARTRNQITEWGKVYDPLADKILIGSMVFAIVLKYVDFWASIIIVLLEIIIIITAWLRKMKGREISANVWGKIKMMLQVAGVVILLISVVTNWAAILPLASATLYLAIAFAIVSLLTQGI